jgi:alpha-tubulin suppressor-like RCC1 family protein
MKWTLVLPAAASLALGGCGGSSGSGDPPGEGAGRSPADVKSTPFKPALPVSFTSIELGYHHTCGLAADGRTYCMGDNEYGQLGTSAPMQRCKGGAYPCSPTPLGVEGTARYNQMGLDLRHSCGLTADGEAHCWGFGEGGQLGDGLRVSSPVPVRVATAQRFRAISHGNAAYNTCAIGLDGQGYCWGIGQDGQNGNGTQDVAPTPTPIASNLPMQAIGVGQGFGCALTESADIYCWGQNSYGKLGTGISGTSLVPALVAGGRRYSALAVGGQHACALDTDGLAWCWGFAASVGSSAPVQGARVPQAVDGARRYVSITAGFQHTCALDADHAAWCWGNNLGGAIGDGTLIDRVSPVPVAGNLRYQQLSAGGVATCGIATDGALACWGSNPYGQMGFTPGDP